MYAVIAREVELGTEGCLDHEATSDQALEVVKWFKQTWFQAQLDNFTFRAGYFDVICHYCGKTFLTAHPDSGPPENEEEKGIDS